MGAAEHQRGQAAGAVGRSVGSHCSDDCVMGERDWGAGSRAMWRALPRTLMAKFTQSTTMQRGDPSFWERSLNECLYHREVCQQFERFVSFHHSRCSKNVQSTMTVRWVGMVFSGAQLLFVS